MARTPSKMTLKDFPSVVESVGLPLNLIKAKPNLLTSLLSPSDGYMQTIRDIYKHKAPLPGNKLDNQTLDPLTLIIDVDSTLIYKFKWTDMLQIGQEIEYDQQKAIITEVHYIIDTESKSQSKAKPKSPLQDEANHATNSDEQYLAHITKINQRIPRCGSYVNGELITAVSVYQINVEICDSFMLMGGGHMKTMTLESIDVTDSEMETPQPTPSIVINIKDDMDKLNKISLTQVFEEYKDEILKIGDDYIALRPNLDKFLYLCWQIFENVTLFTTCKDTEMAHVMSGVHDYLGNKLSQVNKTYDVHNTKLWNDLIYSAWSGADCISQFGVDLSRVFIMDSDERLRYQGLEPNRIKIAKYKVNLNDNELMDTAWPILFECHAYNDIRYGLLGKSQHQNTMPIVTESESLSATMRYLVVLQYTYFKSCHMLEHSHDYQIGVGARHNNPKTSASCVVYEDNEENNKSVYSTDADDEYETSDESHINESEDESEDESDDDESDTESESEETDEEEKERRKVVRNDLGSSCVSMFGGVFHEFIAKCVSR